MLFFLKSICPDLQFCPLLPQIRLITFCGNHRFLAIITENTSLIGLKNFATKNLAASMSTILKSSSMNYSVALGVARMLMKTLVIILLIAKLKILRDT